METKIHKTIRGIEMMQLFEKPELINIKYYNAVDVSESDFVDSEKYCFEILIRHSEDTNAHDLFDAAYCKLFLTKTKRTPEKPIFLISTELGRVKGRVSFYIAEIMPNKGLRLIDNDFTCSKGSNRGLLTEAVNALVNKKELPSTALDKSGFINHKYDKYCLIHTEGQGLTYINQLN